MADASVEKAAEAVTAKVDETVQAVSGGAKAAEAAVVQKANEAAAASKSAEAAAKKAAEAAGQAAPATPAPAVPEKEKEKEQRPEATEPAKPAGPPLVKIDPKEIAMELFLKPQIYVYVGAVLVWAFGYFGCSFFWCLIVLAGMIGAEGLRFYLELNKAIKRHCDNFRQPNLPEHESVVFLNQLFGKVWTNFPGFIEEQVKKNVQAQLDANKPPALTELKLDDFQLGKSHPQLSNFRLWHDSPQEIKFDVQLDWDSDLSITITAAKNAIKIPVTVSHISLHARLRVFARLLPNKSPFVSYVWVQALEKPDIDLRTNLPVVDVIGVVRLAVSEAAYAVMGYPRRVEVDIGKLMNAEITDQDLLPPPLPAELAGSFLGAFGGLVGGLVGGVAGIGGAVISGTGSLAVGAGKMGVGAVVGVGKVGAGAVSGVGKLGMSAVSGTGKILGFGSSPKNKDVSPSPASAAPNSPVPAASFAESAAVGSEGVSAATNEINDTVGHLDTTAGTVAPTASAEGKEGDNKEVRKSKSFTNKVSNFFKK
eukprot:comp24255_c0_seq1/m.44975 comp24255_c0_seq1/g.44975  ORF comp24255_c0_seq1/g.44975 comp24255_c0_seq1/m.44975 type:complete len:537 (-) comp24255_c0_seq1:125-1735(-)